MTQHHRRLEAMYHSAPCNQDLDVRLDIEDGHAQADLKVDPAMHHAAGAVHGSHLFKLLDDAAFFAANSRVEETFVLTVNFDVHFLQAVTAGRLRAVGSVVHEGGSSIIAEAAVRDDEGNRVALGTGSFVKGKRKLTSVAGYADA